MSGQWDELIAETAASLGAATRALLKNNKQQFLKNSYETAFSCLLWKNENYAIQTQDDMGSEATALII